MRVFVLVLVLVLFAPPAVPKEEIGDLARALDAVVEFDTVRNDFTVPWSTLSIGPGPDPDLKDALEPALEYPGGLP